MKTAILASVICALLVAVGVVHGVWSERWSDGADLDEAVARLEHMPLNVGDWEGKRTDHVNDPRSGLAGSVTFRFRHVKSGKAVTVFLACGRPGPVSVHTPDVCYAGAGFEVERIATFTSPRLAGQTFFTSRLVRKRTTEQSAQRIFWAWHGTDGWEVSDNPRVSFAGRGALYKMYVIREIIGPSDSLENDPCVELMEVLLPALEKHVFGA